MPPKNAPAPPPVSPTLRTEATGLGFEYWSCTVTSYKPAQAPAVIDAPPVITSLVGVSGEIWNEELVPVTPVLSIDAWRV